MEYKIIRPYIGGILSDNSARFKTKKIRPPVAFWMKELANIVEELDIPEAPFYKISLRCNMMDNRGPDPSNLHKVIGDALKRALPKDDKYYRYQDLGVTFGNFDPTLEIIIEPLEKDLC
jgi:hypothetical protein